MVMNINSAINAYQSAARSAMAGVGPAQAQPPAQGDDFAGLIRQSLEKAADIGRQSEAMSLKGIAGEADLRDVVMAVNNAENVLQTVTAIRDKVVSAYQEILKMPI